MAHEQYRLCLECISTDASLSPEIKGDMISKTERARSAKKPWENPRAIARMEQGEEVIPDELCKGCSYRGAHVQIKDNEKRKRILEDALQKTSRTSMTIDERAIITNAIACGYVKEVRRKDGQGEHSIYILTPTGAAYINPALANPPKNLKW